MFQAAKHIHIIICRDIDFFFLAILITPGWRNLNLELNISILTLFEKKSIYLWNNLVMYSLIFSIARFWKDKKKE